jgi:hypothetical protein
MWKLVVAVIVVAVSVVVLVLYLAALGTSTSSQGNSAVAELAARRARSSGPSDNARQADRRKLSSGYNQASTQTTASGSMMISIKQRSQSQQTSTRFVKLDFDGSPLPDDAESWHCAQSQETGLVWEVKRFDGGLRDNEHTYTWLLSAVDSTENRSGVPDGGQCLFSRCDAVGYIDEINKLGLCGSHQWRLPTFAELDTLLDRDFYDPVINQRVFIHTRSGRYMTSTATASNSPLIMYIDFFNGASFGGRKDLGYFIRLVSSDDGRP